MKMPGPKGVITIQADQRYTLTCENVTLTHAGRFSEKAAQEQSTKVAKMQGGNTPLRSSVPKPPIIGTPQTPSAKRGAYTDSPSTQHLADQLADDKKKGAMTKKSLLSSGLAQILIPNRNSHWSLFSETI
jgi:hypothetical protein